MTGLRILAWFLVAIPLVVVVGSVLRRHQPPAPDCSGCRDLIRQLANANEHVRLLEQANAALADKQRERLAEVKARRRTERAS